MIFISKDNTILKKVNSHFAEEHNRLMPVVDKIFAELKAIYQIDKISYMEGFYVLAKVMRFWSEAMFTEEEFINSIQLSMQQVQQIIIPLLNKETKDNITTKEMTLMSSSIIEYMQWTDLLSEQIKTEAKGTV